MEPKNGKVCWYPQLLYYSQLRTPLLFWTGRRLTSPHLFPGAKLAHRASTCALHRFLSCAAVRTSLQDCHPALDLFFSTVRRQVVFDQPLFLFPSVVHVRAVTQSLSGCCLRMCPMDRYLLLLISSLNLSTLALSSSSLLQILSLIFIILLRHRF